MTVTIWILLVDKKEEKKKNHNDTLSFFYERHLLAWEPQRNLTITVVNIHHWKDAMYVTIKQKKNHNEILSFL